MKRSASEEPFDIKPEVISSSVGLVAINALELTDLATFLVVDAPEIIGKQCREIRPKYFAHE